MNKHLIIALISSLLFFLTAFFTLNDYGISWDETLHFRRGQAYLFYFLTGKTDYGSLPNINFQGTNGDPKNIPIPRRSFYQNDFHNGNYWLNYDSGHPPLNDISAAILNYIFYQKLGVLDDISSHHIYNILASSLLVFIVVYFILATFGKFAAIISFLSLVTYPLFWSEAHFNIKDPPETAFFAGTIWAFYESLKKGNVKWLILSLIFFTLALGTKFNIIFFLFIIVPYLIIRYCHQLKDIKKILHTIPKLYLSVLFLGLPISLLILIAFWPFLQQNLWTNFPKIIDYYRQIGFGTIYQPESFYILGFNTFPLQWITFTTPPLVLTFMIIGIWSAFKKWRLNNNVTLLFLLWLVVPILRVSLPNMSIYGGIRQVLEFLPALVLLSGVGAWQISLWLNKFKVPYANLLKVALILLFIWPAFILTKLHPNENVYFNFLIGGLQGASEINFPSWGNSFGNTYKQGIDWLNQNAEKKAKVSLIQGTLANAPLIYFRSDLNYDKNYFSGSNRQGEYLMELTFNDTAYASDNVWQYVKNFLEPVYEIKVDNTAILKIWKNDLKNTKLDY